MFNIEFHSDDFGLSVNNSKRIIELIKRGCLDGISIIANMNSYEECMSLLKAEWDSFPKKPKLAVHINLIDGFALSEGFEPYHSWGKLYKTSLIPCSERKKALAAITEEIRSQIMRVYNDVKALDGVYGELRLDSHIHIHTIPIVFDGMMAAITDEKSVLDDGTRLCDHLTFVRLSKEPFSVFFKTKGISFPSVNVVKNIVLRGLSHRAKRKLSERSIEHGYLWGIITGGNMNADCVHALFSPVKAYAENRDAYLEILFHPGRVLPEEFPTDLHGLNESDIAFVFSENRDAEFDSVVASAELR